MFGNVVNLNLGQIYTDGQMCIHLQKQWGK